MDSTRRPSEEGRSLFEPVVFFRSLRPDSEPVGVLLGHLDDFEVIRTPIVVDVERVDDDQTCTHGHPPVRTRRWMRSVLWDPNLP